MKGQAHAFKLGYAFIHLLKMPKYVRQKGFITMSIHSRNRFPLRSSNGIPESCTFLPGAWPAIKIFALGCN